MWDICRVGFNMKVSMGVWILGIGMGFWINIYVFMLFDIVYDYFYYVYGKMNVGLVLVIDEFFGFVWEVDLVIKRGVIVSYNGLIFDFVKVL